jgi:hypothetical protein
MATSKALIAFQALPGSAEVVGVIRRYAEVFDFDKSELGVTWGVSIPAGDNGKIVRVNAWSQLVVSCVFDSDTWYVYIAAPSNNALVNIVHEWTSRGITSHAGQSAATATKQLLVGGKSAVVNLLLHEANFVNQCMEIVEAVQGKSSGARIGQTPRPRNSSSAASRTSLPRYWLVSSVSGLIAKQTT